MDERMACPVCSRPYDIPLSFYVLSTHTHIAADVPAPVSPARMLLRRLCTSLLLVFCVILVVERLPALTESLFSYIALFISLIFFANMSRGRLLSCDGGRWNRDWNLPGDPHTLSDDKFYRQVVRRTRRRKSRQEEVTPYELTAGRVVVHVDKEQSCRKVPHWPPTGEGTGTPPPSSRG